MIPTVWVRPFAFAAAILFLLSWVFPVGAGLAKDTSAFPKWWGTVDVAVAFVLALASFGIQMLVRGRVDKGAEDATYRIYRTLTHGLCARKWKGPLMLTFQLICFLSVSSWLL